VGRRGYDVDFTATTGTSTRWQTLIGGGPVTYPDRRSQDEALLTWDSAPSEGTVDITGTPVAHLEVLSDASDFAVHLYLEAVLPDGAVLYLTEGSLLASHRAPGVGPAPYGKAERIWHTHAAADVEPVRPGAVATLDVQLWPISVLLPAGTRVRIALAGADAGSFRRIPAEGSVHLEVLASSWVDLPLGNPDH
jgi:putative CocE/NonD family hydrolase